MYSLISAECIYDGLVSLTITFSLPWLVSMAACFCICWLAPQYLNAYQIDTISVFCAAVMTCWRILATKTWWCRDSIFAALHKSSRSSGTGKLCTRKNLLPVEQAVHKMIRLSVTTFSIKGLGFIRPGYFAYITLFGPRQIIDKATFEHSEIPAQGIHSVFVNGNLVWENGGYTGLYPGRFLAK